MDSIMLWIVGGLLLLLSPFAGRVSRDYEIEGKGAHESFALALAWSLAVLAALCWRAA